MNVLALVPATLAREGREAGILSPILGKPPLGYLLDRLANVSKLDGIVVTTTDEPEDAAILDYCAARGVACRSGPRDDLLVSPTYPRGMEIDGFTTAALHGLAPGIRQAMRRSCATPRRARLFETEQPPLSTAEPSNPARTGAPAGEPRPRRSRGFAAHRIDPAPFRRPDRFSAGGNPVTFIDKRRGFLSAIWRG
jgi:hypothetical protein